MPDTRYEYIYEFLKETIIDLGIEVTEWYEPDKSDQMYIYVQGSDNTDVKDASGYSVYSTNECIVSVFNGVKLNDAVKLRQKIYANLDRIQYKFREVELPVAFTYSQDGTDRFVMQIRDVDIVNDRIAINYDDREAGSQTELRVSYNIQFLNV